jgi:signal peptidase
MEPTLNIGNIVITKISTYEDIKKGDIVTYSHNLDGKDIVVIHRVVEILNEGVITKGDNRQDNDDWIVPKENIISKTVANLDFKNLDIDF